MAAAATAGLCGAGALATPYVVPLVERRVQQAVLDAALGELEQLEGVSLAAAVQAAVITQAAVTSIVLPVARLVATLRSGALAVLVGALDGAHNALTFLHASTAPIDQLRLVVVAWQADLGTLPIALSAYATADITSAATYLRALKRRMALAAH